MNSGQKINLEEVKLLAAQKKWIGNRVVQFSDVGDHGYKNPHAIGRTGVVQECMIDEKGNIHCRMDSKTQGDSEFWCPANLLRGCP